MDEEFLNELFEKPGKGRRLAIIAPTSLERQRIAAMIHQLQTPKLSSEIELRSWGKAIAQRFEASKETRRLLSCKLVAVTDAKEQLKLKKKVFREFTTTKCKVPRNQKTQIFCRKGDTKVRRYKLWKKQ